MDVKKRSLIICMVLHTFQIGGAEHQLLNLCRALEAYPFRIVFLYSYGRNSQKRVSLDGIECLRVPWFIQKFRLTPFYLKILFLWKLGNMPNLFHCHSISSFTEQILWFAQKKNIPILVKVATEGDVSNLKKNIAERKSFMHCRKKNEFESFLFGKHRYRTYYNATGYLSINPNITKELIQFPISQERIFSILNGVDTTRYKPISEEEKGSLKEKLGLSIETKWIMMVGRFEERKRFTDLIFAWNLIEKDYPFHSLLLIGDGEEKKKCEWLVHNLNLSNRVCFLGAKSNLHLYFQIASLFVFPSRLEGLPNVILEAMASALPIVASSIAGIQETLESGNEGVLVPPMDVLALSRAIRYVLDNPELGKSMGSAARQRVIAYYSMPCIASKFSELYRVLTDPCWLGGA